MRNKWVMIISMVTIVIGLSLTGCLWNNGFEDLEVQALDYEGAVETDGIMKGVSDDGSLMILIEDDEIIIIDVEEDDEIVSEDIDEDIIHALSVRQSAVFSPDNRYVLFTDAPGTIANVLKYILPIDSYVFDIKEEEFIKVIDIDEEESFYDGGHIVHNAVWTQDSEIIYIDYSMDGTSIQIVSIDDDDPEILLEYDIEDGVISEILTLDSKHILVYISQLSFDEDQSIVIYNINDKDEKEIFTSDDYPRMGFLDISADKSTVLLMAFTEENRIVEYDYWIIQTDKKMDDADLIEVDVDLYMSSACLSPGGSYLIMKAADIEEEDFSYYTYNIEEEDLEEILELDIDDEAGRFEAIPFVMNLHNPFSMKITQDGLLYVTDTSGEMHYYEIED